MRGFAGSTTTSGPGCWILLSIGDAEPIRAKLLETAVADVASAPPTRQVSLAGKALHLVCADGSTLEVLRLTPAGKKPVDAKSFWNGISGKTVEWSLSPPPPPPEAADGKCDTRRQLSAAATTHGTSAVASPSAWRTEWERRLGCWWAALPLPTQAQLGGCLGALSLHLGSRLDAFLGRWMPPTASPAHAGAERHCESLGSRAQQAIDSLPDFPESHGFEFRSDWALPPLPRLVPRVSLWELQAAIEPPQGKATDPPRGAIDSIAPPQGATTDPAPLTRSPRVASGARGFAGGAAGGAASALALLFFFQTRQSRARRSKSQS